MESDSLLQVELLTGHNDSDLKALGLPQEKGSIAGWGPAAGFYCMYM